MTYKIEQFVKKIKSAVTVRIGDNSIDFPDGEKLAEAAFGEPMIIDSIIAEDNRIIIQLAKNELINDTNWSDDKKSFF